MVSFQLNRRMTMMPNGKMFAVRVVLFVVCAVGLFSTVAEAGTVRGTFKLPVTAHWGTMVLSPGEYEFVVDTGSVTRVVTVRSKDTGWSGMVHATAMDCTYSTAGSEMKLATYDKTRYVKALYLYDAGVALEFAVPKPRMTKLAKSTSPVMSSASGTN